MSDTIFNILPSKMAELDAAKHSESPVTEHRGPTESRDDINHDSAQEEEAALDPEGKRDEAQSTSVEEDIHEGNKRSPVEKRRRRRDKEGGASNKATTSKRRTRKDQKKKGIQVFGFRNTDKAPRKKEVGDSTRSDGSGKSDGSPPNKKSTRNASKGRSETSHQASKCHSEGSNRQASTSSMKKSKHVTFNGGTSDGASNKSPLASATHKKSSQEGRSDKAPSSSKKTTKDTSKSRTESSPKSSRKSSGLNILGLRSSGKSHGGSSAGGNASHESPRSKTKAKASQSNEMKAYKKKKSLKLFGLGSSKPPSKSQPKKKSSKALLLKRDGTLTEQESVASTITNDVSNNSIMGPSWYDYVLGCVAFPCIVATFVSKDITQMLQSIREEDILNERSNAAVAEQQDTSAIQEDSDKEAVVEQQNTSFIQEDSVQEAQDREELSVEETVLIEQEEEEQVATDNKSIPQGEQQSIQDQEQDYAGIEHQDARQDHGTQLQTILEDEDERESMEETTYDEERDEEPVGDMEQLDVIDDDIMSVE